LHARAIHMAVTPDAAQAVVVLPYDRAGALALLDLESYELTLTELSAVDIVELPAPGPAFELAVATPNPAPGPPLLRFALPTPTRVRLAIYDVRGRLVTTLVDGPEPAGWHPIAWTRRDARGARVASGVYVAKLEALGAIRTQKLVLLR